MVSLHTQMRLGGLSSKMENEPSEAELFARNTNELVLVIDPAERAYEHTSVLTLRDSIGGLKVPCTNGVLIDDAGKPAVDMPDVSRATVDFTVPPSYFLAVAVDIDTVANTGAFVYSFDITLNRLFFGLIGGTPKLRVDHGGVDIIEHSGVTLTGKHVFWASYDALTGEAALGMDAITPVASAVFSGGHKGYAKTDFFGNSTTAGMDGRAYLAMVAGRYLGGAAQADVRATLLDWCAEAVGTTLGV